jgi:hypothetical protein
MGDTQTLVDAQENIWDIYKSSNDWISLFDSVTDLLEVVDANTTGVTGMERMLYGCSSLVSVPALSTASVTTMLRMFQNCSSLVYVPALSTASVTNMGSMFSNCCNVQSGALALYQQASQQANPPTIYVSCFYNCGRDTVTGAAELAQIPSDWGGGVYTSSAFS